MLNVFKDGGRKRSRLGLSHLSAAALFLLLILFSSFPAFAQNQQFHIVIKKNGEPQVGIDILGNNGVRDLPGRYTGTNGEWILNTDELNDPAQQAQISFSDPRGVLRFNPPELAINLFNCPDHICAVEAISDGAPQTVIEWRFTDSSGNGVAGIPASVPGALVSCPKQSDADGYVHFAVTKTGSSCNDANNNQNDNFYSVFPLNPAGKTCTFSTTLQKKFRVCADTIKSGYTLANCSDQIPLPSSSNSTYQIIVQTDAGAAIQGVQFSGNQGINSLPSRSTNAAGSWSFSTSQLNISASSEISLVPTGNYAFSHRQLTLTPNSCPNNVCRIWAVQRDGWKQGSLTWNMSQGSDSAPFVGARIERGDTQSCATDPTRFSDYQGKAVFPTAIQASCDLQTNPKGFYGYLINSPNCQFTHQSSTPFQVCSTVPDLQASAVASCGGSVRENYLVRGIVRDGNGIPLYGAAVNLNNSPVGTTNSQGEYSVLVPQGSTPALSVSKSPFIFDPGSIAFHSISNHLSGIDFSAVFPFGTQNPGDPNTGNCGAKTQYSISGKILTNSGQPLPGAVISSNFINRATSDAQGQFLFNVAPLSDNWITVENGDSYFDPAAVSLLDVHCDTTQINFKEIPVVSYFIGGLLQDSFGRPVPNATAQLEMYFRGERRDQLAVTDEKGRYFFSVPSSAHYIIRFQPIDRSTYRSVAETAAVDYVYPLTISNASFYEGDATGDNLRRDWGLPQGSEVEPTPTATATATATFTNTSTPTATNTATVTNTFTPSKTPTITATATVTNTATLTATPTITRTPTATVTPSKTPTLAPPTATSTSTSTATSTATATSTNTPSATATGYVPQPGDDDYCFQPTSQTLKLSPKQAVYDRIRSTGTGLVYGYYKPGYIAYSYNSSYPEIQLYDGFLADVNINDFGYITGNAESNAGAGDYRAMYRESSVAPWIDLQKEVFGPEGATSSRIVDLNNAYSLLIEVKKGSSVYPVVYDVAQGRYRTLPPFISPSGENVTRKAIAISDNGLITGYAISGGVATAFILNPDGTDTILGTNLIPQDININGYVTGYKVTSYYSTDRNRQAFVYSADRGVIYLNPIESCFNDSRGLMLTRDNRMFGLSFVVSEPFTTAWRAFEWTSVTGVKNLKTAIVSSESEIRYPRAITNSGELLVEGRDSMGKPNISIHYRFDCALETPETVCSGAPTATPIQTNTPIPPATNTATATATLTRVPTLAATNTPTRAATSTATVTATSTASYTPTATRTATSTPTPALRVALYPVCKTQGDEFIWQLVNNNTSTFPASWKLIETGVIGDLGTIPALSTTRFNVPKTFGTNSIAIFSGSMMISSAVSPLVSGNGYVLCPENTATPTPAATMTNTPEPTRTPTHTATATATATRTVAAIGTSTPVSTATSTPEPSNTPQATATPDKMDLCHVPDKGEAEVAGKDGNTLTLPRDTAYATHLNIHKNDYPGPCHDKVEPTPTSTPTATSTATPLPTETATPAPLAYFSGGIFGSNGRAMNPQQRAPLSAVADNIKVRITSRTQNISASLDPDTLTWKAEVQLNTPYTVRLVLTGDAKKYSVLSLPVIYRGVQVNEGDLKPEEGAYVQVGLNFALGLKVSNSDGSSPTTESQTVKIRDPNTYRTRTSNKQSRKEEKAKKGGNS